MAGEVEGGLRGRILARLADGPDRVVPPCPHFADCGGCALQHLAAPAYRRWKQSLIGEALARRGIGTSVASLLVIPPGSRRRAVLATESRAGDIRLGFNAAGSSRIVEISTCLLLTPRLVRFLGPLRRCLAAVLNRGERADAMLTETETGIDLWLQVNRPMGEVGRGALFQLAEAEDLARISLGPSAEPLALRRAVRALFGTVAVDLPPGAFLQPSAAGEAALSRAVTTVLGGRRRIADLYAGCGTFAFALSSFALTAAARIHAVEGDAAASGALAAAAKSLGGRISSERRDLAAAPLSARELNAFDAVLLDPPRAGARSQVAEIAASALGLAVYVSCDPKSFARDARILVDGGFRLERVLPVDQFPWSVHLEIVGVFRRG